MKISFYFLIIITAFNSLVYSQGARNFFPEQEGHIWYYKVTPLNEESGKIDSASVVVVDSFANSGTYFGKEAFLVMTRNANRSPGDSTIYTDSTFLAFEGGRSLQYFSFLSFLNTGDAGGDLSGLAEALSDWYTAFDFGLQVGGKYNIFSKDTTVNLDGQNVPLRIEINGERNADENIITETGEFKCRKFVVRAVVSILITIFPFPPVAVPFLELPISTWISEGEWIVYQYTPSVEVDLSAIGGPKLNIPGSQKVVTGIPTSVKVEDIPLSFELYQNYPNPFNPSTTISFYLTQSSRVTLDLFSILGEKVNTLISGNLKPGFHSIDFSADNLSSGVYFYRLNTGYNSITKKMIISK